METPRPSPGGPFPPPTERELSLRDALRRDVDELAGAIGERNLGRHAALETAADFLDASFAAAGFAVRRQTFEVDGRPCHNLDVEVPGAAATREAVVVGAHYDTVPGCPGANDNATGAAAVLALARAFAARPQQRTLRFVQFVNEEPPYFQSNLMGSFRYARGCRERHEEVVAMLSLETIGYYSDERRSQKYPPLLSLFYPSTGNFIAFVGNLRFRALVRRVAASFRRHSPFPAESGAVPGFIPGVAWSDHWSFWRHGYPALMVTDTAPYRYPHYHLPTDTPDKVRVAPLARVVAGLEGVIADLASPIKCLGDRAGEENRHART